MVSPLILGNEESRKYVIIDSISHYGKILDSLENGAMGFDSKSFRRSSVSFGSRREESLAVLALWDTASSTQFHTCIVVIVFVEHINASTNSLEVATIGSR